MKKYGLIGYPLTHSFSKKYFTEKFNREGIADSSYDLYPIEDVSLLPDLINSHPGLVGLNVTIPHKEAVMPFLDRLDTSAEKVKAVNVIKIMPDGSKVGYNSDYYGFRASLEELLGRERPKALILGTGGASKAVIAALNDLSITYKVVSRDAAKADLTYKDITAAYIKEYPLLINTTPLGTFPDIEASPALPYEFITADNYLFDLVYNPELTRFLAHGKAAGAKIKNGLQMLYLQAEKAWEIWQA